MSDSQFDRLLLGVGIVGGVLAIGSIIWMAVTS